MSDDTPIDETTGGLDRRSLIKRGAIVGGALVWTTPVVQAIASPAFGATPSDNDDDGDPVCTDTAKYFLKFDSSGSAAVVSPANNGNNCILTSEAQQNSISNGGPVAGFVTVVFSADKLSAIITITNGYSLATATTDPTTGATIGTDGFSAGSCDAVSFTPTSVVGSVRTYTAQSIKFNSPNGNAAPSLQQISHLELVIKCP